MSRIKTLTEKHVDLIIRVLLESGLVADVGSANAIRLAPNNASENDLDVIAAGLQYGGVGGAGILSGEEDIDAFIDSDASPGTPHTNYFRISHSTSSTPVTDPELELMTLSGPDNFTARTDDGPRLTVGPRGTLSPASGMYARVNIGTHSDGNYYGSIEGGPTVANGGIGFRLSSLPSGNMEVRVGNDILIRNLAGTTHGGWEGLSSVPFSSKFHVGDFLNDASVVLETIDDDDIGPSVKHFQLRTTATGGERRLYINGSLTGGGADGAVRVAIGGIEGETWGDPSAAHQDTTCLIVSPALGADNRATLKLKHRSPSLLTNQEILTIDSDDSLGNSTYMMRVYRNSNPIFQIKQNGDVNIDGSVSSPAADVAEWVRVSGKAKDYPEGTVLSIGEDGLLIPSSTLSDPKVMGVSVDSSFPALLMGRGSGFDESQAYKWDVVPSNTGTITHLSFRGDLSLDLFSGEYIKIGSDYVRIDTVEYLSTVDITEVHFDGGNSVVKYDKGTVILRGATKIEDEVPMTICGFVPVRVSTKSGSIQYGDKLVAAPGGYAVKAPSHPEVGTVIGKAMEELEDPPGAGFSTGMVKTFVNLT